jgi:dynein heavy chain
MFQAAREVWAKTLWMNLNAEALLDGMESFIGEFRRYKDSVKQLPVGQFLDVHMKQFKNSVPLFVELKNEALRERHWEELMDKTGECDGVFIEFLQGVGKRR